MALESVIALATALLGGLIAAGATLLALFWRMGRATAEDRDGDGTVGNSAFSYFSGQRIDDLRDYLDSKFDTIDRRFESMQAQIDRRFDVVEGRINTVDEEVGKLESRVDHLPQDLSFLNGDTMIRPNASTDAFERNPESEADRAGFDVQRVRPSTAIVLAIASMEDVDPTEIGSLYESIDPEALDTLIQSISPGTATDIQVSARFDEYRVTIDSLGMLEVRPLDGESDGANDSSHH
jgi:hypothetical protein